MVIEVLDNILGKEKIEELVGIVSQEFKEKEKTKEDKKVIELIDSYFDKRDLARQFLEIIPLYYDEAGLWWKWVNGLKCWKLVDEVDILNLVANSSRADTITTKDRTEIIAALKQEARKRKPLPPKKTWIQFMEEIVDIETGERKLATSDYFIHNPIPWKLGNCSDTPVMDKIFEEWVGKKYVKTLYEIIAYCTLVDYPLHRLFCFIGAGMNGKSCFLSLLRKFVGDINCCSTELDTLIQSRFEVTRLHKKLVCQMGETNFNELSKTSIIKKLTGGDYIGFEYKNKTPFEGMNTAKIIIATNNLPTTSDKTIGFYRRWTIIDFPNQFTEKKDILQDIPYQEYENLGMKCIELLHSLLKKREFHAEGNIEDRMARYESKSDFLQKFLDEHTLPVVGESITIADFRKKFLDWCKENRHREMAENTISRKMKIKGYETGRKYFQWLHDGKGGQLKIYQDLKWKD